MARTAITAKIETVTPELAREWLSNNGINRPLKHWRVRAITNDIKADKWALNGETIIISAEGKLLNGQHRATAISKADKAVPTLVVYGVPDDLMPTIDQGVQRSHGDVFGIQGIKYPRLSATVARLLWEYKNFAMIDGKLGASRSNILAMYEEEKKAILDSVALGERMKKLMPMPVVTTAVCDLLISKKSHRSVEFFEALAAQPPTERGSENPLGALQRYLRAPNRTKQSAKLIPVVLKTWNAWSQSEPMSMASYRSGEPFPEIEA